METVIEHTWPWPIWTALIGSLVLMAAVFLLYRREPAQVGRVAWWALLTNRLATCVLLVWILGGWQRQQHRTEPAQLVVAIDDSLSMGFADEYRELTAMKKLKDYVQAGKGQIQPQSKSLETPVNRFQLSRAILDHSRFGWLRWLEQNYRVKLRLIGDTVREVPEPVDGSLGKLSPNKAESRLGQGIRELLETQQGIPTAAFVLLTDGVTTAGPSITEAAETARRHGVPLYLVGMGGGQPPRDIRLADLIADDVAFAGDVVQVEVQLIAEGLAGKSTAVRLRHAKSGEVFAEQSVRIEKDSTRTPIRLNFQPQISGEIPLAIEASAVPGESDTANNRLTHSLRVSDVTIKVLMVQAYPSYEFRFLKNLISRATRPGDSSVKAFELTTILQESDSEHAEQDPTATKLFPTNREALDQFDVILFGDVDPTLLGRTAIDNLVTYVKDHGGSMVIMVGPRSTPYAYRDSALAQLFPFPASEVVPPAADQFTEPFRARLTAVGALSPACQLENLPADNAAAWNELPELYWFVEIPSLSPSARVLVEHPTRFTADRRPLPLISTQYVSAGRVVFHATDETYRWARVHGSDEYYSRYWLQTLRTLSRRKLLSGQSIAEVTTDRQQYQSGEAVQVRVVFRQRPSNLDDVTVTLEQPNGARQLATLQAKGTDLIFTASLKDLSPGTYRVSLAAPLLNPVPSPRSFAIVELAQEQVGVPLNAPEMQQAAKISGGKYYHWPNADRLFSELPSGQRVRIESLPPEPIWNSPLVAGLFVAMLTVEWLLRKRMGML